MSAHTKRPVAAACLAASMVFAMPSQVSAETSQDTTASGCNPGVAAALGALAGGLLGKKNRVQGAAIGAGVAGLACVAFNYQSKQTKSAQTVMTEFKDAHAGQLPEHSTLVKYDARFDPSNRIRAGGSATLDSYIEVLQGSDSETLSVEQEIAIYGPDGKELKKARKPANANGSSGGFESRFSLKMPDGVPQGIYTFKTTLYLQNAPAAHADVPLEIVQLGRPETLAAATAQRLGL